jgi:hypothetical protein
MKPLIVTSAALGMSLMLVGEFAVDSPRAGEGREHANPTVVAADIDPNAIVEETCVRCHSDSRLRGNLSLEEFDIDSL